MNQARLSYLRLACAGLAFSAACGRYDDEGPGIQGGASAGVSGDRAAAPSNQGDRHDAPGTNPFVATRHDPFSTFAADVDTASYDIFRRDANLGMRPQTAGVRLEEYVNYFKYDYPAPAASAAHPFSISLAAAEAVFDRQTTLLRVGIAATKPPPFQKRAANVVFLVDVSGSMQSEDKLPLVKQVLTETLGVLDPTDRVSVVTYASGTAVRLGPTPTSDRARISGVIADLQPSGSTNGAGGLNLAYQQAQEGFVQGGINHIVLCTDGDFNVGPSSTKELLALIKEKRKTGVTLTALGFGIGNLNDAMMEAVSNAGNGIYGVISSSSHASKYVRDRLLDTLVHVARDMKIQVEFNPARVTAYRLLGYEDRAIADSGFRDDAIDAGEVGAGHRVTALYELVLAGQTVPPAQGQGAEQTTLLDGPPSQLQPEIAASDLALVKVRYRKVDGDDAAPALEVQQTLPATEVQEGLSAADPDLRWAVAVAAFAEILKQSPFADRAFLPMLEAVVKEQAARDEDRAEFAQLLAKVRASFPGP